MKHEAIRLTKAQQCEIATKLSKPNMPNKRALGREYEVSEGAIHEVMETMRIEKPPIDDEIQPIKIFAKFESATDFKGFEVLHNNVLDIDNQLLCSDVQTEDGQMFVELRQSLRHFYKMLTN